MPLRPMADGAVGCERLPPLGDGGGLALGRGRIGQALHIGGDGDDRVIVEQPVATKGEHLADAGFRARRAVDAHRDGMRDLVRTAAPQPVAIGQVGEAPALAAGGVDAVTGRAIIPEQPVAVLADECHQRRIGPYRADVPGGDLVGPAGTVCRGALHLGGDDLMLVGVQQTLGIGRADRPGGHHDPVAEPEQEGEDQENPHHARHRRVEFLDAVPLMARHHVPGARIALAFMLLYRHGLSSSSMMSRAALSNRARLAGQQA